MKIKSFIAPTMQEALRNVKKEMGNSPLILEARDIEEGDIKSVAGQKLVEIVAAENLIEQNINKELENNDRSSVFPNAGRDLENDLPETTKALSDRLSAQQVEEEHAEILTREILCDLGKEGFGKMDLQHQMIRERFISKTHKAMVFVGGSGVGKTTAISKLALNAKAHSDKDILLIKTKDDADEKLCKLAEVIGATVWVVTTRQELRMIIDEFKSTSLIFIDTPGINHLNDVELLGLKEYIHNIPNLETHLVVSATTRFVDVINTVKNYAVIPVQRLLFTKVDETDIYGTLFSVAMATKIPLSYITDGQEMQRNVRPVTGSMIAEMILG